jgi:preprotein translocase subunit SecG
MYNLYLIGKDGLGRWINITIAAKKCVHNGMKKWGHALVFIFILITLSFPYLTFSGSCQGTISNDYNLDAELNLTGETYTTIFAVTVGDCDNDGNNELIANYDWYIDDEPTPITVILEYKNGEYSVESEIEDFSMQFHRGSTTQGTHHFVVGDAINDGENEILMPGIYKDVVGIYLFKYDGIRYNIIWEVTETKYNDCEIYDINRDGLNEIIVTGMGIMQWNETEFENLGPLRNAEGVRLGDMDGDGEMELVLSSGSLGIEVYKWEDDGLVLHGSATESGYSSVGFGVTDSDDDGMDEAFRVEYHGKMVLWGWNGSGYAKEWSGTGPSNDSPTAGWAGDSDGDSVGELFIGNGNYAYGISLMQYEFDGTGYTNTWQYKFNNYCQSITIGDSDNDGYYEIIGGSGSNGKVYVFSRRPDLKPQLCATITAEPEIITSDSKATIEVQVECAREDIGGATIRLGSSIGGEFSHITSHGDGIYTTEFTPPDVSQKGHFRVSVLATKSGYLEGYDYTSLDYLIGDSDGDGYSDDVDKFPNDPEEWEDNDGDDIGDNADPDDDNDGMPDDWENENTLDPNDPEDAKIDSDRDGFTNLEEYKEGTDPMDDTSKPEFLNVFLIFLIVLVLTVTFVIINLISRRRSKDDHSINETQYFESVGEPRDHEIREDNRTFPVISQMFNPNCETCGNEMKFLSRFNRWYCFYCGKYK